MLYPVEKLLANRDNLCTIRQTAKVREALAQMAQGDFSQLPVVDEQGNLVGLISEQTITRTYYHVDENVSLFDLTVDHCMAPAVTLNIDADIFEALDRLQRTYAIVITENRKPVGLLTFYDTTHFFRNLTEGLIFVEDIEITLRQYIEDIYTTEQRREQATINAFGMDGAKPRRDYESLTLGQYINLITHPKNWPDFEPFLAPTNLFRTLLDGVRETRNHLAHFRGELDQLQFDQLRRARDWLASRHKPNLSLVIQDVVHIQEIENVQVVNPQGNKTQETGGAPVVVNRPDQGKYTPLTNWLKNQSSATTIRVTFEELETLLGDKLPSSAREHRSWWANDAKNHRHSRSWLAAGWRVVDVDMATGQITFDHTITAFYQLFFADLVQQVLMKRPDFPHMNISNKNYCTFESGRPYLSFNWSFVRHKGFWIELHINTHNKEKNRLILEQLKAHQAAIEAQFGAPLDWTAQMNVIRERITLSHAGEPTGSPAEIAELQAWAVDTMLKFVDTLQPYIKELALD